MVGVLAALSTVLPAATLARSRRAHASACADAHTPATRASTRAMRAAVVCLINQQRAAHGLPRLRVSRRLDRSAQRWTNAIVARGIFRHGDVGARIRATGFVWQANGENIASGFLTPSQLVRAWMASAGHCQNILSPVYTDVGTGLNRHRLRGYAPGTWTQDFALPMHQPPASRKLGPANGCPYSS
jgi:uncharacterized protein YkwD